MFRNIYIAVVLFFVGVNYQSALADSKKDPLAQYTVLLERNIFSRARFSSKPSSKVEIVQVAELPYVTLNGITDLNGKSTIFTSGTMLKIKSTYSVGDVIGPFTVDEINPHEAVLKNGEESLTWVIGSQLQSIGDKWKVVHMEPTYTAPVRESKTTGSRRMGGWKRLPEPEGSSSPVEGLPGAYAKFPAFVQKRIMDKLKSAGFIDGKPMAEQPESVHAQIDEMKKKMQRMREPGKRRRKNKFKSGVFNAGKTMTEQPESLSTRLDEIKKKLQKMRESGGRKR